MNTTLLELEIKELKKKLKKTEMERDILKKAAAYFANQDQNDLVCITGEIFN